MSKHAVTYLELINELNYCKSINKPYTYERAGNSVTLTPKGGLSYYANRLGFSTNPKKKKELLPKKEIYFINKVKEHILKNKLHKKIKPNYKDANEIKYFDFNREIKADTIYKKCYSVDVTKAYWVAFYNNGWITKELFIEGLDKDKRIRLAAIGHWAKETDVWKSDGYTEKHVKTIKPKYPHVFFNQAYTINQLMKKCINLISDNHLLMWVDCIKCKDFNSATLIEKTIYEAGFTSKTTKLTKVERTNKAFISYEKGEKPKDYNISLDKNLFDIIDLQ